VILENIHCCKSCGMIFMFSSDVEDHERMIGHSEFVRTDFDDKCN